MNSIEIIERALSDIKEFRPDLTSPEYFYHNALEKVEQALDAVQRIKDGVPKGLELALSGNVGNMLPPNEQARLIMGEYPKIIRKAAAHLQTIAGVRDE